MRYTAKLNRRDTPYVIADEALTLSGGRWEGWPGHDNVDPATIEIYTLPGRQGEKVLNYTTEIRDGAEWKLWLRVFAAADVLYLSYETTGDVVEADDINQLQGDLEGLAAEAEADRLALDGALKRKADLVGGTVPVEQLPAEVVSGDIDFGTFDDADALTLHETSRTAHPWMLVDGNYSAAADTSQTLEEHMANPLAHQNLDIDGNGT